MTVRDSSAVHAKYVDLSSRFRAVWAFDQYLGSLHKVLLQGRPPQLGADLQQIYNELKAIAQVLHQADEAANRRRLDNVEERIRTIFSTLVAEDSKLAPYLLRQFFQRVKNQDEKILVQLARFYVYANPHRLWPTSTVDKVDFLMTKIAGEPEESGAHVLISPGRLREIGDGLWNLTGHEDPTPEWLSEQQISLQKVRDEVEEAEELNDLTERDLVKRFRDVKHEFGPMMIHPDLMLVVLRTNLAIKNLVNKLARVEERRIAADYQRIFELEREVPVDQALDRDLNSLRDDVERFEKNLATGELRLEDLGLVRRQVEVLSDRLTRAARPPRVEAGPRVVAVSTRQDPAPRESASEILQTAYDRLCRTLGGSDPDETPKRAALSPELFSYRLEPREIMAYRRMSHPLVEVEEQELDRFILEAAALRMLLNDSADEIRNLLEATIEGDKSPIFVRARRCTRLAGVYLSRFQQAIEQAVHDGRLDESQNLLVLRMRLLRDYSGTWLLADKPLLAR